MFDENYYNDIWGTVHRHEDIGELAKSLLNEYGRVRYLDIGTGCGWLVETLNDLGAEAVGIEISPYALVNAHDNVCYGDFRDIPFPDNYFDVVCSNGVLEYIPEADITKALLEAERVGKVQYHTVDYANDMWYDKYAVTNETPKFWQKYGVINGLYCSPA